MLGEIVASGNRRQSLEGLRDFYAGLLDEGVSDRAAASIGLRLESVLAELEGLKASDGDTLTDELERRRMEKQQQLA